MSKILNKVCNVLKEIVIYSKDRESQEKALNLLLEVNLETHGIIRIDNYNVPVSVYNNAITEMKNDQKIRSIKILRDGVLINNDPLRLRQAKELSERISIIEKIPMVNGYSTD